MGKVENYTCDRNGCTNKRSRQERSWGNKYEMSRSKGRWIRVEAVYPEFGNMAAYLCEPCGEEATNILVNFLTSTPDPNTSQ